jgi:hypothetical protein
MTEAKTKAILQFWTFLDTHTGVLYILQENKNARKSCCFSV